MDVPILKLHWERFKAHVDLDLNQAALLLAPYTKDAIDQLILLSEGCANTNYKVTFKNKRPPIVIRIYIREKTALALEVSIHRLVANQIPVPCHYYADDQCTVYAYPYAIMEWIEGQLMREIVLTKDEQAISECAYDAGKYLNVLRQFKFPQGGFFTEYLQIRPFTKEEEYPPFMLNLLADNVVQESLGASLQQAVTQLITTHVNLFSQEETANLTHADYDPANMLVKQINSKWQIAAILDWEFAFAGTYLLDMGLMLRYSHKLPACYEKSFIAGIETQGTPLPLNWKKQAKLMDLLCLLQLAHSNPFSQRPKMNRDVVSLIADTINNWQIF